MGFDIIGIGSPLIDLLAKVEDLVIKDIGVEKGGMYLYDDISEIYEKIETNIIKTLPGDSTANTIVGCSNIGANTAYIGKVGEDNHGDLFISSLTERGVTSLIVKSKSHTGKVIALITPDQERTMIVSLGACKELESNDINAEEIVKSKYLHLTGYQLEEPGLKKAAMTAINIAKKNNVKISIDLADFNLVKRNLEQFKELLNGMHIIFANEEEAKAFTGKEPKEALEVISELCEIAVVKIGKDGSLIKKGEKVYEIPAYKVDAIDTTGAGDMYAAGVLFGLTRNHDLEMCGKIGAFAASKVVEQIGARLDYSLKDKIDLL